MGKHTITLADILSCINNNRYIQKGTDYIEIPQNILEFWQRGNGIIENGRIKMPKLGYLRTRAECGKNVGVTACNETQKFLLNLIELYRHNQRHLLIHTRENYAPTSKLVMTGFGSCILTTSTAYLPMRWDWARHIRLW